MKLVTLAILLTLAFATMANAQSVYTQSRVDTVNGCTSYTFGAIDLKSGIEVWTLGQPQFPDNEIGKTWPMASGKNWKACFSAYAIVWPKAEPKEQYFLCPWPSVTAKVGSATLKADFYAYMPLNGGPWCFGTNDTGVKWPIGNRVQLGLSGTSWKACGAPAVHGIGPSASVEVGKYACIDVRYIPSSWGDRQFRFQLNYTR